MIFYWSTILITRLFKVNKMRKLFVVLIMLYFSTCFASNLKNKDDKNGHFTFHTTKFNKKIWINIECEHINGYLGCNHINGLLDFHDKHIYLKWIKKTNILCPSNIMYSEKKILNSIEIMKIINDNGIINIVGKNNFVETVFLPTNINDASIKED